MARKDEILQSFLEHDLIKKKYKIESDRIPNSIREGLNSSEPIFKTISLIIENLESSQGITDKALRDLILQHLNQTAI